MTPRDDAELLRLARAADEIADSGAGTPGPAGSVVVLARTKTVATYPTAANRYYAFQTLAVLGAETEGGAGTLTALGDTFFAYNCGTAIPASGTDHVVAFTGHRWVFRHD